jgi:hypothetical protein
MIKKEYLRRTLFALHYYFEKGFRTIALTTTVQPPPLSS